MSTPSGASGKWQIKGAAVESTLLNRTAASNPVAASGPTRILYSPRTLRHHSRSAKSQAGFVSTRCSTTWHGRLPLSINFPQAELLTSQNFRNCTSTRISPFHCGDHPVAWPQHTNITGRRCAPPGIGHSIHEWGKVTKEIPALRECPGRSWCVFVLMAFPLIIEE
jgi:hypothetical protein